MAGFALKTGGRVSTVPENNKTLTAQQRQLISGHRIAQMFPHGTPELPLPSGHHRVETKHGIFHFDPNKISKDDIQNASKSGHENHVLGLGPFSKQEIMDRVRRGEHPIAVVERHGDGTELRAAAGTHATAHAQMAHMMADKAPGSHFTFEDPRETISRRAVGGGVNGYDAGGQVSPTDFGPVPYANVHGYIPSSQPIHAPSLMPAIPKVGDPNAQSNQMMQQGLALAKQAKQTMNDFGKNQPLSLSPGGFPSHSSPVGTMVPMGTEAHRQGLEMALSIPVGALLESHSAILTGSTCRSISLTVV